MALKIKKNCSWIIFSTKTIAQKVLWIEMQEGEEVIGDAVNLMGSKNENLCCHK